VTGAITVIGFDGGPLRAEARAALAGAVRVAGVARHLGALPVPAGAERVDLAKVGAALDAVTRDDRPSVVVASGDPGFFGIVRALRARGVAPYIIPAVSSVARAFAAVGMTWDDALVISAHGRDPRRALAAALAAPKCAILTAPGTAEPGSFTGPLRAAGRRVHVAERLGTPDERVTEITSGGPPRTHAHPNVVIADDPARPAAGPGWLAGHQGAPDGWALPEPAFDHRDGQITKSEVRAVALARLAPRPGVTVWDVGAGSGSVAVECARFGARAIAIDRDPAQCARVRANAARHAVHVQVEHRTAPDGLADLPDPDAVFAGGGDAPVLAAVLARTPARVVVALASVDRVRPVRDALRAAGYEPDGCQLQSARLADLPNGSIRLTPTNPVTLIWGTRPDTRIGDPT
jgi:precorrin-6Y C5,15-methyltransferase (decarboxylating)